jgi:hypothetical protein
VSRRGAEAEFPNAEVAKVVQAIGNAANASGRTLVWLKTPGWVYGGGTDTPMTTQVCRLV